MKKLALIGCGGIGSYHLEHFLQFHDVELAGFCDLLLDRAQSFVKKAGSGKAYSDFIQMYDEVRPDLVFLCVPPTCHGRIEFETIRRGIPFFVEKPLALDMKLARELVRQVEEKGLIAASGFQCRYDTINETAMEFIDSHPVLHVAASRVGGDVYKRQEVESFPDTYGRKPDAPCGSDPMLMFFTSGTTGYPKIAEHNYKYALGHYITAKYWHNVNPDGLHFTISDTGWGKALWGKYYGQWMNEAAIFTYDFDKFDANDILPMFAKYHITTFCAPPTMYRFFIKEDLSKYDLSSIEYLSLIHI